MKVQQSNVRDVSNLAEWSANSQEAKMSDTSHNDYLFGRKIDEFDAKRIERMLTLASPAPSLAGTTPPLSRQDSEVFVVFEKPSLFASLKTKLAKLFCLASPDR